MKFVLAALISLLMSVTEVMADGPTLEGVANDGMAISVAALTSPILASQCGGIINCGQVADLAQCAWHSKGTIDGAQVDFLSAFTVGRQYMTNDLKKFATDPGAINLLKQLESKIDSGESFNLWTMVLNSDWARCSKDRAMRFIAAFFQDRGFKSNLLSKENLTLVNRVGKKLTSAIRKDQVRAYPPGVDTNKTGIYHFYGMGVIAANMRANGVPLRYAAALPISVNVTYEEALNRTKNFQDVYTGVAGVEFALSPLDSERYTGWLKYPAFQKEYSERGLPVISESLKTKFGNRDFCESDAAPALPKHHPDPGLPIPVAPAAAENTND